VLPIYVFGVFTCMSQSSVRNVYASILVFSGQLSWATSLSKPDRESRIIREKKELV
jgi:hypothetical protein